MIEAKKLVKWFGPKLAVDDVSFTVNRGEVLGFLGPNGAGKSTSMRMITGYIPLSSGSVVIGGHDISDEGLAARSLIGYLPENAPVYMEMTVTGFLRFAAEVRGLWGKRRDIAVEKVIETCFLQPVRRQAIDTLSKGYRHRTCLAQCLLHDPPALVMDEPTDGLDPNQKHEVRNLIKRMGAEKAIILSTHILEEVDAVCSRVIIIDRGKLIANGTPSELRARAASAGSVTVRVNGVTGQEVVSTATSLSTVDKAFIVGETGGTATVKVLPRRSGDKPAVISGELAAMLTAKGWKFDELHVEEGRLDEFFRAVTIPDTAQEVKS